MSSAPDAQELFGPLADRFPSITPSWTGLDERWIDCGAAALTGPPGTPLLAPRRLGTGIAALAAYLDAAAARHGGVDDVDPFAELTMRVRLDPAERRTQLVRAADDWVAVSSARPDDEAAMSAWLEAPLDGWPTIAAAMARRPAGELVERAVLLGLPVARLGEATGDAVPAVRVLHVRTPSEPAPPLRDARVVDLSSLWAGPLCTAVLRRAGASVVKVESTDRPDGARLTPRFYAHLHEGDEMARLDFGTAEGRASLEHLLRNADVVVTASRPRALAQLGIDVRDVFARGRAQVWIALTAHGGLGAQANRVGFGDDTAAAGGLVAWHEGRPWFASDAIADPLTGFVAAAAALASYGGERVYLDIALARVAAVLAGRDARRAWRQA